MNVTQRVRFNEQSTREKKTACDSSILISNEWLEMKFIYGQQVFILSAPGNLKHVRVY